MNSSKYDWKSCPSNEYEMHTVQQYHICLFYKYESSQTSLKISALGISFCKDYQISREHQMIC